MSKEILQGREVIIEFFPIGQYVKVSAMDVESLVEASIQGPANAPEEIVIEGKAQLERSKAQIGTLDAALTRLL